MEQGDQSEVGDETEGSSAKQSSPLAEGKLGCEQATDKVYTEIKLKHAVMFKRFESSACTKTKVLTT